MTALTDRHEGQAAALAADEAVQRCYRHYFERAVDVYASMGIPFSSDSVRNLAGDWAARDNRDISLAGPNVLPSVMGQASAAGRIVRQSDVNSTRRSRHGSRIGVYVGRAS